MEYLGDLSQNFHLCVVEVYFEVEVEMVLSLYDLGFSVWAVNRAGYLIVPPPNFHLLGVLLAVVWASQP